MAKFKDYTIVKQFRLKSGGKWTVIKKLVFMKMMVPKHWLRTDVSETMSEKERKRFHELADQDKKRYETEMESYTPPENEKGRRGKKRKQNKDPNAPKRPLTAFFLFINDERSKVKQANPEFTVGEVSKELGRRWAAADSSIKSKYEEMADKDKIRYEREMTEYKKRGKFSSPVMPTTKEEDNEDDDEDEEENDVE